MLRASLLLAFAAFVAHPAVAQTTEKEVVAQVKSAAKVQLKAFKQNMAAALSFMDANLTGIENLMNEDSDALTVGSQCASVSIVFMTALNEDFEAAKGFIEGTASLALTDLADGGELDGQFPKDCYLGVGGLLDTSRAQLVKAGLKARDAAIKRLRKTAGKAEKIANIGICFDLMFPTRVGASCINDGAGLGVAQGVTLDFVLSASDMDVLGDGLLAFGGATEASDVDVSVGYFVGIDNSDDDEITPTDDRFTAVFQNVAEGGAIVHAKQGTGGTFHDMAAIGVR
jgi:hypothetical protein